MANRVGTRCASIPNNGNWAAESERASDLQCLQLRLVLNHSRQLPAPDAGLADGLAIVFFTRTHAAAGRAKNQWQIVCRWLPSRLSPGLMRGQEEQPRCAAQPALLPSAQAGGGHLARQIDF